MFIYYHSHLCSSIYLLPSLAADAVLEQCFKELSKHYELLKPQDKAMHLDHRQILAVR